MNVCKRVIIISDQKSLFGQPPPRKKRLAGMQWGAGWVGRGFKVQKYTLEKQK